MYRSDREGTIRRQTIDRSWPAKTRQTGVRPKVKKKKRNNFKPNNENRRYENGVIKAGGNPWLFITDQRKPLHTNAYSFKIQQSDRPVSSTVFLASFFFMIVSHFCLL